MTAFERHQLVQTILNDWTGWSKVEKEFICRNPEGAKQAQKVMAQLGGTGKFCWIGAVRVAMFHGAGWRNYTAAHWNDTHSRGFRDWAADNSGSFFTQTCNHCQATSNPVQKAMAEGLTFAQFEKAYPNFVWPAWPRLKAQPKSTRQAKRPATLKATLRRRAPRKR